MNSVFALPDGLKALAESDRKILLYGMGNGAEKAYNLLTSRGIPIHGVFASDGFVRGHSFLGYKVLSIAEAEELYGDYIAVLSFALEGRKADILEKVTAKHKIFMPYTPVYGTGVTDKEIILKNKASVLQVYSLLGDEISRSIYRRAIAYCITGDIAYLKHEQGDDIPPDGYYTAAGVCVDVGAYTGDTAEEYFTACPSVPEIICFEPDRRSHAKLLGRNIPCVTAYNAAAGEADGETLFSGGGSRSSSTGKGKVTIPVRSIDSVCADKKVACIKIDAEGDERAVISGCKNTLRRYNPVLNVSLYHRVGDLWELPLLLYNVNPNYKLYIRKKEYVPLWDISVYCI